MDTVLTIVVILHILCWAVSFGMWFSALRTRRPSKAIAHAAGGALVLGLVAMIISMGMSSGGHLFYALKLVGALVVTACAFVAASRQERTNALVWYLIPVGIVFNVVIAMFHVGQG